MTSEPSRNSFRSAVVRGERPALVLTDKMRRREATDDSLEGSMVQREEVRRGNHRGGDRHRLQSEAATARYVGEVHDVEVVNLSSGGAMIRCDFAPRLWDMIELTLGDGPENHSSIECAVRWLRDDLVGLEFAHETQIDCDPRQRAELLLDTIQRSFPDSAVHLDEPEEDEPKTEVQPQDLGNRFEKRHPLIWKGEIHYAFDSNPVRLRNISEGGALVDVAIDYPLGAELMLDLGDAGQFGATVTWAAGDQAGLKFDKPFDLACLSKSRPEIASHQHLMIDFGQAAQDSTPWDAQWSRSSLAEMRDELEGYLKR
jgi:hypothetical protein